MERTREATATVVVFNRNDPDSEKIARYYADRRNIPPDHIVGLDCPLTEEIHRADYERTLATPLRKVLFANGWWKAEQRQGGVKETSVRFLALIRGIPLKIAPDPTCPPAAAVRGIPDLVAVRNDASVDSELAVLGIPEAKPGGLFPNPYFNRFTPALEDTIFPGILFPARLDGPDPVTVRRMIDDAILAEQRGLWGWAYVDARGITQGDYAEGDTWLRHLAASLRSFGVPVIFDNEPPTFQGNFPITDAALYFGWYSGQVDGPFADAAFRFVPGAVAVHLHSFSAATLRSASANWCGPLLDRGAAATLGNVYEPYLTLTACLDIFQNRLMAGFTLAESGYMSQRALSWMGVVIGDPLYRPYASWRKFHDPSESGATNWQAYRALVMAASGNVLDASPALREEAKRTGDSLFLEALGAAQSDNARPAEALESFREAEKLAKSTPIRIRLAREIVQALAALPKETPSLPTAQEAFLPPSTEPASSASSPVTEPATNLFSAPAPLPAPPLLPSLPP